MNIDHLRHANPAAFWDRAIPYARWVEAAEKQQEMWDGYYRRARAPNDLVERARRIGGRWRFLVIAEDWCGDAFNTIPFLQRFVDAVDGWEMRLIRRDANPELMNRYLTEGARSIPVVVVLDETGAEAAWWGPRPEELQAYFQAQRGRRERADLYRELRTWYVRDRGRTTLEEVLDLLEGRESEAA
ncbi:MAG TPA: thioredoxin family protein [Longimicrobiales bacterium]|nr:thioredoxin family protein [Longimicrobiales bacterium]